MDTLSRREEETLLKATKSRALKECDQYVRAFAECSHGRTISIAWACRDKLKEMQGCIHQYTNSESMALARKEYIRVRGNAVNQQGEENSQQS